MQQNFWERYKTGQFKIFKGSLALLFLFGFLFMQSVYAQDSNCPKPKKKALKIYQKTQESGVSLSERHILLVKAIEKDPDFQIALDDLASVDLKKTVDADNPQQIIQYKNNAIKYWKKIVSICPAYREYYISLQLAKYYYGTKDYADAKTYIEQYLNGNNRKGSEKDEALKIKRNIATYYHIMNNPVPFKPQKLDRVSTNAHDEFLPMLSPDNRYLFFTRKTTENTHNAVSTKTMEMLTESRRLGINQFSNGVFMPTPFNQGDYQGGVSISVNNKTLYITIVTMQPDPRPEHTDPETNQHPLVANGDIYYSTNVHGEWSALKSVGPAINQQYSWEGQPSVSSDGQTLYFVRYYPFSDDAAKHPEYKGGMDIYKSERQPNGKWGAPVNLGDSINTSKDEKTPFIHSDSHTLYFSSNGHVGVGGFDIYYDKMKKDSTFGEPVDLGYPINTKKDEVDFIVSKDGKKGYFASNKNNATLDIYSFDLYKKARPDKVIFVEGQIKDSSGKVPEGVKIELKNTSTGEIKKGVIDTSTGKYVAVVTIDSAKSDDIMLMAKKKGYAFASELVSSNKNIIGRPIKTPTLAIKPIEVGQNYKINNINFTTDSYALNEHAENVLNEFIDFLNTNSTVKIQIQGYTDNVGGAEKNMTLSENRAKVVYHYLITKGIKSNRLSYKGFGQTNPVATNDTPEGRAKNRRTTFLVVGK